MENEFCGRSPSFVFTDFINRTLFVPENSDTIRKLLLAKFKCIVGKFANKICNDSFKVIEDGKAVLIATLVLVMHVSHKAMVLSLGLLGEDLPALGLEPSATADMEQRDLWVPDGIPDL